MRFLPKFFARHDRTESARRGYVDQITLADASEGKYHALTPIPYADALTPTMHSLPRLDPHDADLRQVITDTVARLAAAGALDEFTMDVLDNWIDAWHETWVAPVMKHAEVRRETAARLISVLRESLVRESNELETLAGLRVELTTQRSALSEALGLPQQAPVAINELPSLPTEQTSLLYNHLTLPLDRPKTHETTPEPDDH